MHRCRRWPAVPFAVFLAGVVLAGGTAAAGEIVHRSFDSEVLGREYRYSVYFPDDYEADEVRYPVLYLLHGASGNESSWPGGGNVRATVDRLVAAGEIPPLLVVMPGHSNGWWVDGHDVPAATVIREELLPHVDSTLRTIPHREGRFIGGLSAGGYGAVNLALDHPYLFAAAAALSPAVYTPLPPERSGSRRNPQFARDGVFDPDTWRRLNYPLRLERYATGRLRVPFFLLTGRNDELGITAHTQTLFHRLWPHQPGAVELRIVDGGHDWSVWRAALPDALRYLCRFVPREWP